MRVTIVSNCQGEGIAACLMAMNPGFEARFILLTQVHNGTVDVADIFSESDYVFAQREAISVAPAGSEHKLVLFPPIAFDAFHPDLTFVRGRPKGKDQVETVPSNLVVYHSAIALFGYCYDKPVDEIVTYYNYYIASRLGYLDRWNAARDALLAEANSVGMPLGAEFRKWSSRGAFMYSSNHPHLYVLADIARRLMEKIGIPTVNENVADFLPDALKAMPIWPVYPFIANKLNLRGDFSFKQNEPLGVLSLRDFVQNSYTIYDGYEKATLESMILSVQDIAGRLNTQISPPSDGNPYKGIDRRQFWRNSVASIEKADLDPVIATRFKIGKDDKVATAGSCFAQNIARTLSANGFNYYVTENAPDGMSAEEGHGQNFRVFSARYGNIYTVRQLVQLIDRAYGRFNPEERYWHRKDGRLVDPFRPQIDPDGFLDVAALDQSREQHFKAVREMLEEMDVFVFTLGLTEGWRSKIDGAIYPLAPGVSGGMFDPDRHEYINFTAEEVTRDLLKAIDLIKEVNQDCRILLTVSPVPLIATYEKQHALVSTTYSKSALRIAANEAVSFYPHVDYFASYEIITGSYNHGSYYHEDLREVTEEGVAHVMRIFMRNYPNENGAARSADFIGEEDSTTTSRKLFDIVCDEEAIARF